MRPTAPAAPFYRLLENRKLTVWKSCGSCTVQCRHVRLANSAVYGRSLRRLFGTARTVRRARTRTRDLPITKPNRNIALNCSMVHIVENTKVTGSNYRNMSQEIAGTHKSLATIWRQSQKSGDHL